MKIFVTGGTGFIGTRLIERLAQTPHTVVCLVRPTSSTEAAQKAGAHLVVGDVTVRETLHRAMEGCDAVINLANIYEFWRRRVRDFRSVNVEGTRNVMEVALAVGVKKVVHVSTLAAFGHVKDPILTESSLQGTRHPSRYSRTKCLGEQVAWELHRTQGLPLVVVYPGATTGAGDTKPSGRYIEALVRGRLPSEVLIHSRLAWVHVDDVVEIIVRALEKEGNIGERYIAAAETLTFREVNRLVGELAGVKLPRLVMPTPMLLATAATLTLFGRLFRFEPMLGMSLEQMRTMRLGFSADGSKASRELDVRYKPVRVALAECIAHIREETAHVTHAA